MAVVTESQFNEVIEPGLRQVFTDEFNELPTGSLIGPMYRMESSDKANEDYLEIEDIGNVPEFNGTVAYTEFKQGNKKTVTNTTYALGLKIARDLIDDDLYGVIEDMVRQMGSVARYRMEQDAASPFVNAFNTSFTVFDSLSLCNSAHSFVSTSTTQSNSGSTAFAFAALDATVILMRKFKGSQDRFMLNVNPDMLVGPVELDTSFREVVESKLKPGTANNDINVYNSKFTILTTPFLTDTNNWFLVDGKKMKRWLLWQQRTPLEFSNTRDFDTFVKKYALYMRYKNTPLHWPWVYGHAVA
jgi:phage major head subunit gpT-like protein